MSIHPVKKLNSFRCEGRARHGDSAINHDQLLEKGIHKGLADLATGDAISQEIINTVCT